MDYLLCGDLPYPAWKKRVSAQDLRNRRIRRYFVCRLKRSEARDFSHVRFTIIVELAEQLQDCGIEALTIHGRTRAQMYTGEADWTLIGEVKKNPRMHIPIIGNGDITTPQRAKECFEQYGVDAIMIGRASFGRPWIFKEVKHYLETGEELPPLSFKWRMDVLRQEVLDSVNLLDERRGILHVRRHLAASPLFKGIPNFKDTRIAMLRAETLNELNGILDHIEATFGKE